MSINISWTISLSFSLRGNWFFTLLWQFTLQTQKQPINFYNFTKFNWKLANQILLHFHGLSCPPSFLQNFIHCVFYFHFVAYGVLPLLIIYSSATLLLSSFKHRKFVQHKQIREVETHTQRVILCMLSRSTCVFDRSYNFVFNLYLRGQPILF